MTEKPSKPEPSTKQKILGGLTLGIVFVVLIVIGSSIFGGSGDESAADDINVRDLLASATAESLANGSLIDRTAEMQAVAGDAVIWAGQRGVSSIEIETSIVDPRGGAGSAEALRAIGVCQAAQGLGYTAVSVREADGTTFVVLGQNFGDGVTCTEV